ATARPATSTRAPKTSPSTKPRRNHSRCISCRCNRCAAHDAVRPRETRAAPPARCFAMHGIAQVEEDAARHGQMRYSLWSGDLGFAVYLWDCLRAGGQFPTLDVFYAVQPGQPGMKAGS